jgi:inhibitor of KinA
LKKNVIIKPWGRKALIIEWPQIIDPDILYSILAVKKHIETINIAGLSEIVQGYASLTLIFTEKITEIARLEEWITSCPETLPEILKNESKLIEIPVCYDSEFALDREEAEGYTGLGFSKIVEIHSAQDYLVYFIGFMPGFMYLGGLDKRLEMPRKDTPRLRIPSGSVGIAGLQTGIYPIESPGGWQIIGKSQARLFNPYQPPWCPAKSGDRIKFLPISKTEFDRY